jgi:hypothetical protein
MGYLPRQRSRARWRDEVRAANRRRVPVELRAWVAAPPEPPRRHKFVRLATSKIDPESHERQGIFIASDELRRGPLLSKDDRRELRRLLTWFGRNLRAPRDVTPRAVFWFRVEAFECIEKVWELVRLLGRYDVRFDAMTCDYPGSVAYEDERQVAAIPYADRRPQTMFEGT